MDIQALYIPCFIVLCKRIRELSCYKFMTYIAVVDTTVLCVVGALTGYFTITGAVFCSYPTLIYFCGMLGNGNLSAVVLITL